MGRIVVSGGGTLHTVRSPNVQTGWWTGTVRKPRHCQHTLVKTVTGRPYRNISIPRNLQNTSPIRTAIVVPNGLRHQRHFPAGGRPQSMNPMPSSNAGSAIRNNSCLVKLAAERAVTSIYNNFLFMQTGRMYAYNVAIRFILNDSCPFSL